MSEPVRVGFVLLGILSFDVAAADYADCKTRDDLLAALKLNAVEHAERRDAGFTEIEFERDALCRLWQRVQSLHIAGALREVAETR